MRIELSANEIFNIIALKRGSDGCGLDCNFYNMGEYGIKRYYDSEVGEHTFRVQDAISETGYAPKCWNYVSLEDGSVAYLTEVATMAVEVRYGTRKRHHSMARWCDLLRRKLRKIFPGIDCRDMHQGNWGFLRMRPVIIDVGHFNGPDVFQNNRWDKESEYESDSTSW